MQDHSTNPLLEAENLLVDILTALRSCSSTDFRIPLTLENLTRVYLLSGQVAKAIEAAEQCRQLSLASQSQAAHLTRVYNNLAVAYRRAKKFDNSERAFADAIQHLKGAGTDEGPWLEAYVRFNRGILWANQSRWAEAEEDLRFSLQMHQDRVGPNDASIGDLTNNLGVVAYYQNHYTEADRFLQRALAIWRTALGATDPRIMAAYCNLAALYRGQGSFAEAEWFFQRALKIRDLKGIAGSNGLLEPFFANLKEAPNPSWRPWLPEVGLLRPVDILDEPLTIDMPDGMEQLPGYREQVRALRSIEQRPRLDKTVEKLGPWYHNIEIVPGLMTNPALGDHPASRWRALEPFIPADLSGKSVLDIGCNAGYFSLQMKRRGAARVVGIDVASDVLSQARFMSAWEDLPIEIRETDTYDIEKLGAFDYVVFVGVLYHLKHPLYALEKIANVCKDTLFFQTVIRGPMGDFDPHQDYPNSEADVFNLPEYPKLYFIEESFNGDVSNWWFATQSCLKAMVRSVGFREIIPTESPDTFVCRKIAR